MDVLSEAQHVLNQGAQLLASLPFRWVLLGHCLFVASLFRGYRDRYLLCYWLGFMMSFGGSVVTCLVLGEPQPLLAVNDIGLVWTAAWWVMTYCPGDLVGRVYDAAPPLRALCRACVSVLRSSLIVSRVDHGAKAFPGVLAAPLFLGSLAGCAGKLAADGMAAAAGALSAPGELSRPGFSSRSALAATLLYYGAVHAGALLLPAQGKALVTAVLVAHALAAELAGAPLDFTEPLARAAHALTLVPMPGAKRAAADKKAAPAGSGARTTRSGKKAQ